MVCQRTWDASLENSGPFVLDNHVPQGTWLICLKYFTLRSLSSLNNPQNSEMKICENMIFSMLKIIIIIIGYTPNNIIVDDGKICNFKVIEQIQFLNIFFWFLSMCKLTLHYDNHVSLGTQTHLSQETMILKENGISPSPRKSWRNLVKSYFPMEVASANFLKGTLLDEVVQRLLFFFICM